MLRELALSSPTFFFQQVQTFFDVIFYAVRDGKPMIREAAVQALRAALVVTSQRETKEAQRATWCATVSFCDNDSVIFVEPPPLRIVTPFVVGRV